MKKLINTFGKFMVVFGAIVSCLVFSTGTMANTTYITSPYVAPETGLLLDKSAATTGNFNSLGREIYKLNFQIESSPEPAYTEKLYDIVIVVDTSGSMNTALQGYNPITATPSTTGSYYVFVGGQYYLLSYNSGNSKWYYTISGTTYYVAWSPADNYSDLGAPGSTNINNPTPKPFYLFTNSTRLEVTKTAITNFINTLYTKNKSVKIGVVEFNGQLTYSVSNDIVSGLQPIQSAGSLNPIFTTNIYNLVAGGATHSNTGIGHAYDILRTQSNNNTRPKMVIMFTDGEPGNYGFDDDNGSRYAAGTMNQASQLKADFGTTVNSNFKFNSLKADKIYGYTHKTTLTSDRVLNGYGLGATVYTIGLYGGAPTTLMNDYMSRVSSNYSSTNTSVATDYYQYSTTAQGLNNAFQSIVNTTVTPAGTIGKSYTNLKVKDYIDPRFQVVTSTGTPLNVGQTFTSDGKTGTIMQDANGIYIEWTISSLSPGYVSSGGGYVASAYVIAKDSFIGGNTVPTNIANTSGVYTSTGSNIGSFPNPTVNVPFNFSVTNKEEYIILGQYLPENMTSVQTSMYSPSDTNIPANLLSYSFNESFSTSTLINTDKSYNLTVTADPQNYIDFSNGTLWTPIAGVGYKRTTGETYKNPVGTSATTVQKTGTYTVKPIVPNLEANSRTILYGDLVGVNLKDLIEISLTRPSGIVDANWNRLNSELAAYWSNMLATYTSAEEPATRSNTDLAGYEPLNIYGDNSSPLTLHGDFTQNGITIATNIQPNIFVVPAQLSITKTVNTGTTDQGFIFYVYRAGQLITKVALKDSETVILNNLKKGQYTIQEDTNWSWRYAVTGANPKIVNTQNAVLSQGLNNDIGTIDNTIANVNFINSKINDKWLSATDQINNKLVNQTWVGD
ncbi:MAG: VWA domain-containing protein [Fusobacteria bacterium]|nr:VWA domain-containing protein [Fusobacteriota bacterium]